MREKLFRGKRIDNGEWCIGFYCQVADESDGGARVKHVIVVPTFKVQMGFLMYEVDPDTVGEFTSLYDRKNKEIFEGDILERTNVNGEKYKEYVVAGQWSYKWTHGVYGFSLTDLNGGYMMDLRYTKSYEIIGNIHDNPEILKGE